MARSKSSGYNYDTLATGPAEQVRQTRQLLDQSYRNPQFKIFTIQDTLIVLAN